MNETVENTESIKQLEIYTMKLFKRFKRYRACGLHDKADMILEIITELRKIVGKN